MKKNDLEMDEVNVKELKDLDRERNLKSEVLMRIFSQL